jgi:uncharacterized OsmC-like protein
MNPPRESPITKLHNFITDSTFTPPPDWAHHLRMADKNWSIRAVVHGSTALSFFRRNEALFAGGERAASISPVEHLLIGASGCLALSCLAVLKERRGSATPIEVTATGTKAADPPSRLRLIELAVRFGSEIGEHEAASIVDAAEKLCTVTNTLLGSPTIRIDRSRVPQESPQDLPEIRAETG